MEGQRHVWALRSPRSPKRPRAAVPRLHTLRKRPSRFRPKISSSHLRAELTLTHAPVSWLSAPPPPRPVRASRVEGRKRVPPATLLPTELTAVLYGIAADLTPLRNDSKVGAPNTCRPPARHRSRITPLTITGLRGRGQGALPLAPRPAGGPGRGLAARRTWPGPSHRPSCHTQRKC